MQPAVVLAPNPALHSRWISWEACACRRGPSILQNLRPIHKLVICGGGSSGLVQCSSVNCPSICARPEGPSRQHKCRVYGVQGIEPLGFRFGSNWKVERHRDLRRKGRAAAQGRFRPLLAAGNSQLSVADSSIDEQGTSGRRRRRKSGSTSVSEAKSDDDFTESEGEGEGQDRETSARPSAGQAAGAEDLERQEGLSNEAATAGSSSDAPGTEVTRRRGRRSAVKAGAAAEAANGVPKRRGRPRVRTAEAEEEQEAAAGSLGESQGSDSSQGLEARSAALRAKGSEGPAGEVNGKVGVQGSGDSWDALTSEGEDGEGEGKGEEEEGAGNRGKKAKAAVKQQTMEAMSKEDTDEEPDKDGEGSVAGLHKRRGDALKAGDGSGSEAEEDNEDWEEDEEDEDEVLRSQSRILRDEGVELATVDPTDLKQRFVEVIMECSRRKDPQAAEEALTDMKLAGLSPGPRAHHGVVVAHTQAGDFHGAIEALKRVLMLNLPPLQETLIAVIRVCGAQRQLSAGESILGLMGELGMSPRVAWCTFVEELWKAGDSKAANELYLKGMTSGPTSPFLATDRLTDLLVEGNCQLRDHGAAVDILDAMQARGRRMTTFHYNCLLMAQCYAGMPEVCLRTFERMMYTSREALRPERESCRPDAETYNWILQCYARQERNPVADAVEFMGTMVEDYERVQPNARTYALLVEIFSKSGDLWREAVRHLRALLRFSGGLRLLDAEEARPTGHPLTLLLRMLSRTASVSMLAETLETMVREGVPLPAGAMRVEPKGRRTLVTSWMFPLNEEPDYGVEIDYSARFVQDGGVEGTRSDWKEHRGDWRRKQLDEPGFWLLPAVTAYRDRAEAEELSYRLKLLKRLQVEGPRLLGEDVSEEDVTGVQYHLMKEYVWRVERKRRRAKAASKMLVAELRAELEGQGLPTEGKRQDLYWRVQKARRLNLLRGQPLWLPEVERPIEEVPERTSELMSRLHLRGWEVSYDQVLEMAKSPDQPSVGELKKQLAQEKEDVRRKLRAEAAKSMGKEGEGAEEEEEEEEDGGGGELDEEEEGGEDGDEGGEGSMLARFMEETVQQKRLRQHMEREDKEAAAQRRLEEDPNYIPLLDESQPLLPQLELEGLMTLEYAWRHHWEKDLKESPPETYSEEAEFALAMRIFDSVLELGGRPSEADCVLLIRQAAAVGRWQALLPLVQAAHRLDHPLHINLLRDTVQACLEQGSQEQAKLMLDEIVGMGVDAPHDLLAEVLTPSMDNDFEDVNGGSRESSSY